MFENSYEKIWEELSGGERTLVTAIARMLPESDVKKIRELISFDSNTFSTYKDTLNKCGLLSNKSAYGKVEFSLPFFEEYHQSTVNILSVVIERIKERKQ